MTAVPKPFAAIVPIVNDPARRPRYLCSACRVRITAENQEAHRDCKKPQVQGSLL